MSADAVERPPLKRPEVRPRRRFPLRRVIAAVAVVSLLVGGLLVAKALRGDDEPAKPTRQITEVDVRAPSRVPTLKPAAMEHSEAGATAFALFWFDALNWSLANGDTQLLADYTGAGCGQCNGYLIALQKWKDSGARLEGGLTVPLQLSIGPYAADQPVQLASAFITTPAQVVAKDGSVTAYAGGRTQGGVTVLWANGRWQMTDIVIDVSKAPATP